MLHRRQLLRGALCTLPGGARAATGPGVARSPLRVAIVGGGAGGLCTAWHLQDLLGRLDVTVYEREADHDSCLMSNHRLAGLREGRAISYERWRRSLRFIHENVLAVSEGRVVSARSGALGYDAVVVATGIEFLFDMVEGHDEEAATRVPHAWRGRAQLALLRRQLQALPTGGVVVIATPRGMFRCPPAPSERASLLAATLARTNPRAKIVLADSHATTPKDRVFAACWRRLHGGGVRMASIERIAGEDGGAVEQVDTHARWVLLENGERIRADVINLIPPQFAGRMLQDCGIADRTGWCPVATQTMESLLVSNVYVVGDAALALPMPKSASSAASQARACAQAIAARHRGLAARPPALRNACFSAVAPGQAISVVHEFSHDASGVLGTASVRLTNEAATAEQLKKESARGDEWYRGFQRRLSGEA